MLLTVGRLSLIRRKVPNTDQVKSHERHKKQYDVDVVGKDFIFLK